MPAANFNLEYGAIVDNYEGSAGKVFTSDSPFKSITLSNDGGADVTIMPSGDDLDYAVTATAITVKGGEVFTGAFRGGATTITIANASASAIRAVVRR